MTQSKRTFGTVFAAQALAIMSAWLCAAGCSKDTRPAPAAEREPAHQSAVEQAIDGATGKTAVEVGKKAAAAINDAARKKEAGLEEVLSP